METNGWEGWKNTTHCLSELKDDQMVTMCVCDPMVTIIDIRVKRRTG